MTTLGCSPTSRSSPSSRARSCTGCASGLAIIDGTADERPGLLLGPPAHRRARVAPYRQGPLAGLVAAGHRSRGRHLADRRVRPPGAVLLPYLAAPALEAGLLGGVSSSSSSPRPRAARAAARAARPGGRPRHISFVAQWVVLALCLGLLAAWVRRVRDNQVAASTRLRRPPTGCSPSCGSCPVSCPAAWTPSPLSQGLLRDLPRRMSASRAPPSTPAPRAAGWSRWPSPGSTALDWTPALRRRRPGRLELRGRRRRNGAFTASAGGYAAVLPLRVGVRTIGLVGLERTEAPFTQGQLSASAELVAEGCPAARDRAAVLARSGRSPPPRSGAGWPARSTTASPRSSPRSATSSTTCPYRATDDEQRESSCSTCAAS